MKKTAVITTTITLPENLPEIYKNAQRYDQHNVHYYVVGDNKSPVEETKDFLEETIPEEDFTVWSIQEQKEWLKDLFPSKHTEREKIFQENNYQRRILGFIKATMDGAETIISVDDDNFPRKEQDFIGIHNDVLGPRDEMLMMTPSNGYVNYADVLTYEKDPKYDAYVRGYPLHLRGPVGIALSNREVDVAVNVGLWSGSPDISALTRLTSGDLNSIFNPKMHPIGIEKGCHASMCMQNLAFDTEYLLLQYEFPMNYKIGGLTLGRYDDIWAGYVCKKMLDHFDKDMIFGPPVAIHNRHEHDYRNDFIQEFWGMYINTFFYTAISTMHLESKDMLSAYTELIKRLSLSLKFQDSDINEYFNKVWSDMHNWAIMLNELDLVR